MFKFVTVPIQSAEAAELELNSFLQSHRILAIDRRWVEQGPQSFWVFCIDYLLPDSGSAALSGKSSRSRLDYREVLTPDEFARFARLRELRKSIAQTEAVPVYTIFTNEQLATMVRQSAATQRDLERIPGVGDGRVARYGVRFLDLLNAMGGENAPSERTLRSS